MNFFKYGHKLAGPALQEGGKVVANSSMKLGFKTMAMEVVKTTSKEVGKAVALQALKYGIEKLLELHLSQFCKNVGEKMLSVFNDASIYISGLRETLKRVLKTFGKVGAEKLVQAKIQAVVFGTSPLLADIKTVIDSIMSSVKTGIRNALSKAKMAGKELQLASLALEVVTFLKSVYDVIKFVKKITSMLIGSIFDLNNELTKSCNSATNMEEHQVSSEELETFQSKAVKDLKSALGEQAGELIREWTAKMLNKAAVSAISLVAKEAKKLHRNIKENSEMKEFRQLVFKEREKQINNSLQEDTASTPLSSSEVHIEECMKILKKTKSAKVFAAVVREGVPMDRFCVQALEEVLPLIIPDIPHKVKIRVETSDGQFVHQTLGGDADTCVVTIKLDRASGGYLGHYSSEGAKGSTVPSGQNNCMLEATTDELRRMFPDAKIPDAKTLREETANQISNSPSIQHSIQSGWHQYTLNERMYGGVPLGGGVPYQGGPYGEVKKTYSERNVTEADHQPAQSHINKYAKDVGVRNIHPDLMPVITLLTTEHAQTLNFRYKAYRIKEGKDYSAYHETQRKHLQDGNYDEAIYHAVEKNWFPIANRLDGNDRKTFCDEIRNHFDRWAQVNYADGSGHTVITPQQSTRLQQRFDLAMAQPILDNLRRTG